MIRHRSMWTILVWIALGGWTVFDPSQLCATRTRKSYVALTPAEAQNFVNACLALKAVDPGATNPNLLGYDDFVKDHGTYSAGAHGGPAFLAWHRQFLLRFEDALRSVNNGQYPNVTVPYWDWTVDGFPTIIVGGPGDSSRIVTTGPFAYSTGNWTVNLAQAGGPELRRNQSLPSTAVYSAVEVQGIIDSLRIFDSWPWDMSSSTTTSFRSALEENFHNGIHVLIGGNMGFVPTAVNDPVFWLHHANVDRVWCKWQVAHETELHHIPCSGAAAGHNAFDTMAPFGVTPTDSTNMIALDFQYDDCSGPCVAVSGPFQGQTYAQAMAALWNGCQDPQV